jgi:tetratricopeptide (TPR) repeat protein
MTEAKEKGGTLVLDPPGEKDALAHAATEPGMVVEVELGDPSAPLADVTPELAGRYSISAPLGEGGMGTVWTVFDRHLQRTVALKELRPNIAGSRGSASDPMSSRSPIEQRFVREARVTGSLQHPAIPPVYEIGQRADGTLYYTMRVVAGRTLADALHQGDLGKRLSFLPQYLALCSAVAYAHAHRVIHRDLKPSNVMLGNFGETVVLDWGLAKLKGEREERAKDSLPDLERASDGGVRTMAGAAMGTPSYMPPEQARGAVEEIDERSDVFALGAILYELITGRTPHVGETGYEILKKVLEEPIVPPLEVEPRAPRELAAIAQRALQAERDDRYPDAAALARDVQAFLTGEIVGAHRYRWHERFRRWVQRRRWALVASVLVVAAASGSLVYRQRVLREAAVAAERTRAENVLREVDRILAESETAASDRVSLDSRVFRLVSLREPATEERLISRLADPASAVRRVTARALGAMQSKNAVQPLIARLGPDVESDQDTMIDVIVALGMIGDERAEEPVAAALKRQGPNSTVWKATEIAYRMIPLPEIPAGTDLGAKEWVTRGLAQLRKRNIRAAIEHFDRAIERDPTLASAYNNRAIARRRVGDDVGALGDFQKALERDPSAAETQYNLALVKLSLGQHRSALGDLDRVVQAGKLGAQALRARAQTRGLIGELDAALADITLARKLEPKNPQNETAEADLFWERDEWDKAIASTYRALELNPNHTYALLLRSAARRQKGDLDGSLADLEKAVSLEPWSLDARAGRASLFLSRGDRDAARKDLDFLVESQPADPLAWAFRAVYFHAEVGDWKSAEADLTKAVSLAGNTTKGMELELLLTFVISRQDAKRGKAHLAALAPAEGRHLALRTLALAQGRETTPDALGDALDKSDRCLLGLARGMREEHAGNVVAAPTHYEPGKRAIPFDEAACVLCRLGAQALSR